jgi:purine-nucleoside phosphorylase
MTKKTINETVHFLIQEGFVKAEYGIILGTGLGKLLEEVEVLAEVNYSEIPHFPVSTVEYHSGKLIFGKINNKEVIIMNGRFHLYEGYNLQEVTYGVRILNEFGVKKLIVSNASGAVNLSMKKGEIMLIEDHINLQGSSPLAFANVGDFGTRFTDMCEPYDVELRMKATLFAKQNQINLHQGVYTAVVGPQLETKAEYRMLKIIGSDAVGMSTVPEVIVANHLGIKVLGLSVLTDECDPNDLKPVDIPEILAMAAKAEPSLIRIVKSIIE